jgi:hypothetical protein
MIVCGDALPSITVIRMRISWQGSGTTQRITGIEDRGA